MAAIFGPGLVRQRQPHPPNALEVVGVGRLVFAQDGELALPRQAAGDGADMAQGPPPAFRIGGAGRVLRRDRLAGRNLGQEVEDGGLDGVAHPQPPRFRVSRAMTTCWIWLVPS